MRNDKKIIHAHLYSQNCLCREVAAELLSKTNSPAIARLLVTELENKNRYIAIRAAWGLSLMKEKISLPLLVKALKSSNSDACHDAGWALKHMKSPRAERELATALKSPNLTIRREAASALSETATARKVTVQKALIKMLPQDLGHATLTLGHTKSKAALNALAASLKTRTFTSRAMAILGLARAKDARALEPAIEMLKVKSYNRVTALRALRLLDNPATLISMAEHITHLSQEEGFNTHNGCMKTIDSLKNTATSEFLLPSLHHADYKIRLSAVVALGAIASKNATMPVIRLLKDKHWLVRGSAAESLGKIQDVKALNPLIRSLSDKSWYVRRHSLFALGTLKDSRAVHALLLAFRDKNELVRETAAKALSEIADPKTTGEMIKGLTDKNPSIRRSSAEGLGKLKARKAVPVLLRRLSNEQWSERVIAAETLGNIGDSRVIEPLKLCLKDNNAEVYLAAEKALRQINEPKPTVFRHTHGYRIR